MSFAANNPGVAEPGTSIEMGVINLTVVPSPEDESEGAALHPDPSSTEQQPAPEEMQPAQTRTIQTIPDPTIPDQTTPDQIRPEKIRPD